MSTKLKNQAACQERKLAVDPNSLFILRKLFLFYIVQTKAIICLDERVFNLTGNIFTILSHRS